MMQTTRRAFSTLVAGLSLVAAFPATTLAAKFPIYTRRGLAIRGTDPVAYFTAGRPVSGSAEHRLQWGGVTWRFASAGNRAAFAADPEAYAPQYGGYCAWAVAHGYTASTVPEAWEIVDGKLYLNFSLGVRQQWRGDIPGNIRRADANWPGVLE